MRSAWLARSRTLNLVDQVCRIARGSGQIMGGLQRIFIGTIILVKFGLYSCIHNQKKVLTLAYYWNLLPTRCFYSLTFNRLLLCVNNKSTHLFAGRLYLKKNATRCFIFWHAKPAFSVNNRHVLYYTSLKFVTDTHTSKVWVSRHDNKDKKYG